MITMDDIIREGHPSLKKVAKEITFPLTAEQKEKAEEMLQFLKNSQDTEIAEKYQLRGGVGLAAPQIDWLERVIAVHVPNVENPDEPLFSAVMMNPKILSHSVEETCLAEGEGCLSVDREVPGYVVRHSRISLEYTDLNGDTQKVRLRKYPAIVVQHEIDHLNGIMFYDHINPKEPWKVAEDVNIMS